MTTKVPLNESITNAEVGEIVDRTLEIDAESIGEQNDNTSVNLHNAINEIQTEKPKIDKESTSLANDNHIEEVEMLLAKPELDVEKINVIELESSLPGSANLKTNNTDKSLKESKHSVTKKQSKNKEKKSHKSNFDTDYNTIIEALNSNVISHDIEEYENLKGIIEQIGELGKNAHALEKALNRTDSFRQKMLENELRIGLGFNDDPIGSKTPIAAVGVMPLRLKGENYDIYEALCTALENLGLLINQKLGLENLSDYKHQRALCESILKHMNEFGLNAARSVTTQVQKTAWLNLLTDDGTQLSKLEIEQFMLQIDNVLLKHDSLIKQHVEWKKNKKGKSEPNIAPLLQDIHSVLDGIDAKMGQLKKHISPKQENTIKRFTEQLELYYEDQVKFGLTGGRSFTPVKQSLGQIQLALKNSPNFETVLDESRLLDDGIERINVLHWAMDNLIEEIFDKHNYVFLTPEGKKIQNLTPGHKLSSIEHNNKELKNNIDDLKKARMLRNEIAHNGLIFAPEQMYEACDIYDKSIELFSREFNTPLDKIQIKKNSRAFKEEDWSALIAKVNSKHQSYNSSLTFSQNDLKKIVIQRFSANKINNRLSDEMLKKEYKTVYLRTKRWNTFEADLNNTLSQKHKDLHDLEMAIHSALTDRKQGKIDLSIEEFEKVIADDLVEHIVGFSKDKEYLTRNALKFIRNYFAKQLFNSNYFLIAKHYKAARKAQGIAEADLQKYLTPACINYAKNKDRLKRYEQDLLNRVVTTIQTELEQ